LSPELDEAQIVSYLLGELPDEQRTVLEERFLQDEEYRELIRAVEDDLIDEYVRGELTPRQRELFERQFASRPRRTRKVELARALNRAFHEEPRVVSLSAARNADGGTTIRPLWRFRYALAAAAMLLLAIGVWLVIETRRAPSGGRPQQAQQQPPPARPQTPPDAPNTASGQAGSQPLAIATFVLPPGLARDANDGRPFVLPEGTQTVRLSLPLEQGDEYPIYRAELRTTSGQSVWKADSARAATDAAGRAVVLDISADLLQADRYELTLTGVISGTAEDIGYYYFSFVKK
jgi:hypothetical protein